MKTTGLGKTDLVRSIVHEIDEELVRPKKPKDLGKLREIATVVAA